MLIVRTNKRYFSCVVGGDFHPHFHGSLDIKIATCTILKTGSDLTALFSSATQKHKKICRFTASVQALQHFLACLQNSNFCSRCCSNLFTLVIDTEFASLEIVGDFFNISHRTGSSLEHGFTIMGLRVQCNMPRTRE